MRDLISRPGASSVDASQSVDRVRPDAASAEAIAAGGTGTPEELLLLTGSPREVLARIVPGDPLQLRERVADHLTRHALLFDADRVLLRSFALAARQAVGWRGRPVLHHWLEARVSEAVDQLLDEKEDVPDEDRRDAFDAFATPLGLDPTALRRACGRFDRLDHDDREAFFKLAIEGCSLDDLSRERGLSAPVLARRARRSLDVLRRSSPISPCPNTHLDTHRSPQTRRPTSDGP